MSNSTDEMVDALLGKTAPAFTLSATPGHGHAATDIQDFSVPSLQNQPLVVFFYPRDDTPGCTNEAKDFAEHYQQITALGADVLGVSCDSYQSHQKFIAKLQLPFSLLTDVEGAVASSYGCYKLKKMYGKEFMGIERSTFLINKEGKVSALWRKVKVPGHVEEVIRTINNTKL